MITRPPSVQHVLVAVTAEYLANTMFKFGWVERVEPLVSHHGLNH